MTSWLGFSRGAYQIRILAGMIYEVKLHTTHNCSKIMIDAVTRLD